jgi:hypothetical protein
VWGRGVLAEDPIPKTTPARDDVVMSSFTHAQLAGRGAKVLDDLELIQQLFRLNDHHQPVTHEELAELLGLKEDDLYWAVDTAVLLARMESE